MSTWASIALWVVLLLVAFWAMWRGWLRRARVSEAAVPAIPAVPDELGATRLGPLEATYVSSTTASDWLDRVAAHDLGNPGAAQVEVHDSGVLLRRRGATDLFVPAARLRGVGTAPGMAGKFMGGDGLVVLTWDAGADRLLDTGVL
ncbi:MAG: hypothetical protein J0I40_01475, partial [Cellulomonas sp.]|nr:hypothetical protein [Cellulomonas sp.]